MFESYGRLGPVVKFHSPSVRLHLRNLGDVGNGGRLRYLHGKANTAISVYMYCWLLPVFWVCGLWP